MSESKISPLRIFLLLCLVFGIAQFVGAVVLLYRVLVPALQAAEAVKSSPPDITLAEFGQLETGISYEQAVTIVGAAGRSLEQETASASGEAPRRITYEWTNPDGSSANVMFQDDTLVSKTQSGLK